MNVSSHEEYGLRCALRLAESYGSGPIPASRISEKEGISVEYASKFMHLFRKAGLVDSSRGTQGGFQLVKKPTDIALTEVLQALDPRGLTDQNFCGQFSGQKEVCANYGDCSVRPLWSLLTFYFDSILGEMKLADLQKSEAEVREQVESILFRSLELSREISKENQKLA